MIFCNPINKKFKDDLLFDEKLINFKRLQYNNSNFNSNNNLEEILDEKNSTSENKNDNSNNFSNRKKVKFFKFF